MEMEEMQKIIERLCMECDKEMQRNLRNLSHEMQKKQIEVERLRNGKHSVNP